MSKEKQNKNTLDKLIMICNILILSILVIILFVNAVIIVKSYIYKDKVPGFMGWKPFITVSGSMEPVILKGDIAIVKEIPAEELKVGDIIAFKKEDIVVVHRIAGIDITDNGAEIITKGDANKEEDEEIVLFEDVEGVFKYRVAKLGDAAMFLQTSSGAVSVVVLSVGVLLIVSSGRNKKEYKEFDEKQRELLKEIEELKKEKINK